MPIATYHVSVVGAPIPAGKIRHIDRSAARQVAGVVSIILSKDLKPAQRLLPESFGREPALALDEIFYRGQAIALIVADSVEAAQKAEELLQIECHETPAITGLSEAIALKARQGDTIQLGKKNRGKESTETEQTSGTLRIPSRETPLCRDGKVTALHDGETLHVELSTRSIKPVKDALETVITDRGTTISTAPSSPLSVTGGDPFAAGKLAALISIAARSRKGHYTLSASDSSTPLWVCLSPEVIGDYYIHFDKEGTIVSAELNWSLASGHFVKSQGMLAHRILQAASSLYHPEGAAFSVSAYYTNQTSGALLPADGIAQATALWEEIFADISARLKLPILEIKLRNLGEAYSNPAKALAQAAKSDYEKASASLDAWNAEHRDSKRAIALTPTLLPKFFDSATRPVSVEVFLRIHPDASLEIFHSCMSLADGSDTSLRADAARFWGIPTDQVSIQQASTEMLPNSADPISLESFSALSEAVLQACQELKDSLSRVAEVLFAAQGEWHVTADDVSFSEEGISARRTDTLLTLNEVLTAAAQKRVSLAVHKEASSSLTQDSGTCAVDRMLMALTIVELDVYTGAIRPLYHKLIMPDDSDIACSLASKSYYEGLKWVLTQSADDSLMSFPRILDFEQLEEASDSTPLSRVDMPRELPFVCALGVREAAAQALRAFGVSVGATTPKPIELSWPLSPETILPLIKELAQPKTS